MSKTQPAFVFVHRAWHNAATWRQVMPVCKRGAFQPAHSISRARVSGVQGSHGSISSSVHQRTASRVRQSAVDTRTPAPGRYRSLTQLFLPGQFHAGIPPRDRPDAWPVSARYQVR
jgi:hypothetical protein